MWVNILKLGLVILLAGVGLPARAQEPTTNPDPNQPKQSPTKKQGRSKAKKTAATPTEAAPATTEAQPTAEASTPQQTVPAEQTDLSGTYTGTFTCDQAGLTGDTTLTIAGNQFTTSDGRNGRIVATTTRGYTAVALQPEGAAGAQSQVISLRGKKSGNRLTLTSVSGSATKCSFVTGRSTARRRPVEPAAAPATGTTVSSPAEAGPSPADVAQPATRRSKNQRTKATPPAAAPAPAPAKAPMPQPVPETPVPAQTPSPVPSPTPSGSPTPNPSPSPEGSPSPTPTPTPKPPVRN